MPSPTETKSKERKFWLNRLAILGIASIFLILVLAALLAFFLFQLLIPALIMGSIGLGFGVATALFSWENRDTIFSVNLSNKLIDIKLKALMDIDLAKTSNGLFFVPLHYDQDEINRLFSDFQNLLKEADATGVYSVLNESLSILVYFRNYMEGGSASLFRITEDSIGRQRFFLEKLEALFSQCIERLDKHLAGSKDVDFEHLLSAMILQINVFEEPFITIPNRDKIADLYLLPVGLCAIALTKVTIASNDNKKISDLIARFEAFQSKQLSDFFPNKPKGKVSVSQEHSDDIKEAKERIAELVEVLKAKKTRLSQAQEEQPNVFSSPLPKVVESPEKTQQRMIQNYFKTYWNLSFMSSKVNWFSQEDRALSSLSVYRSTPPGAAEIAAKNLAKHINTLFGKEIVEVRIQDKHNAILYIRPDHFQYILIKAREHQSKLTSAKVVVDNKTEQPYDGDISKTELKIKKYFEREWNLTESFSSVGGYICKPFPTQEAACHYSSLMNQKYGNVTFVVESGGKAQLRISRGDMVAILEKEEQEQQKQQKQPSRWW